MILNKRFFDYVVLSTILLIIGIFCGYGWRMIHEQNSVTDYGHSPAFENKEQEDEFNRKIKKHGLFGKAVVIRKDPIGYYFIREGKRCEF